MGSFSSERTACKLVIHDAVAMFDACTPLQGLNNDIGDRPARHIQILP